MYKEIDELLVRAKSGERKAKSIILEKYKPLILSQMKKYYFDANEVDDLISEGYEVILKGIDKFDSGRNVYFSGYLKTILRYHYLDRLKAKKYTSSLDKNMGDSGDISLLDLLEADVDLENEYIVKELNEQLIEKIEKLSKRQKEVIILYYLEELSISDISKQLGVTYRTIINTKVNAIEKLKKLI